MQIRNATPQDMPAVLELIRELAIYEKEPDAVVNSVEELTRDGFGAKPVFDCIVAELEGQVVGFALFYTGYSTWKGRTLYLEDFLVAEAHRRKGIGKLLFDRVVEIAKERDVRRMDWQVLDWNEPAIKFYEKYKATIVKDWYNGHLFF